MSRWYELTRRALLQATAALGVGVAAGRALAQPFRATGFDPPALYLTWIDDPCTTMTVHWHTVADDTRGRRLFYKPAAPGASTQPAPNSDAGWTAVEGKTRPLPGSDRVVHVATLKQLRPDQAYDFYFEPAGPVFRFSTLPDQLPSSLRFIVAGDIYKSLPRLKEAFTQAGKVDARFAVFAGDIAYDNGSLSLVHKCLELLSLWKQFGLTADGCLMPILPLMGNHEVEGGYNQPPEKAQAFRALYELPDGKSYRSLVAADYLALYLMDTDHTEPVAGVQTQWLSQALDKHTRALHQIPIYHVPAYPSSRTANNTNKAIQKNWVPLFESHAVGIAFEHHDHTYKRTHPIRQDAVAPDGIVYFGDGGWALAATRVPKKPAGEGNWLGSRWYLARTGSLNHFNLVELSADKRVVRSLDLKGNCFDTTVQDVKTRRSTSTPDLPIIEDPGNQER